MRYVPIYCEKFSASSSAIEIIELAICSINYVTLLLYSLKDAIRQEGARNFNV